MSNKSEIGRNARDLVFLFYEKTQLKYVNRDIMVAIQNAKKLMNAGYTFDEIKSTIEYCVENPPPKGIYSFGFISYEINKVLNILKSNKKEEVKTKALEVESFNDYGLGKSSNKDKLKPREIKVDTSIFK